MEDETPDITQYFVKLLESNQSIDMAHDEFKRIMADDPEFKEQYRAWCNEQGYNPRTGFKEWLREYIENCESIYDTLDDFDDYD